MHPDVNFEELARLTDGYNGAQLKAVCVEAGMLALLQDATEVMFTTFPVFSPSLHSCQLTFNYLVHMPALSSSTIMCSGLSLSFHVHQHPLNLSCCCLRLFLCLGITSFEFEYALRSMLSM